MSVHDHNVDKHMQWLAIFPSRLATVMYYLSVLYKANCAGMLALPSSWLAITGYLL